MKMKVLLLLPVLTVSEMVSIYRECAGGPLGAVQSLDINVDCSSGVCRLQHNHNVTLSVTFQPQKDITEAKSLLFGIIANTLKVPGPFPGMPINACQNIVGGCPVTAGTTRTYISTVFIKPSYPKIRLVVQWELRDQADQKVFCFAVPVEIAA